MKKKYSCEVDCANCANKMETAAKKVQGVKDVQINFMMQKLTLEADDENFDKVFEAVVKECQKVDSDFEIKK